jgi:hypothetical protein
LFSATGLWEFRFKWARDLTPSEEDTERIQAIQRIDDTWSPSLKELLERP